MQCAASMLQYRKDSIFNLGSAETKLLYTLHWVLLDAGDECALEEVDKKGRLSSNYNFPVSSITTFVYLFAPLAHNIRETDFEQNMRLQNGKKIWEALWEFRHPDLDCFTAQVKPRKTVVKDVAKKASKDIGDPAGIFMGEPDRTGKEKVGAKCDAGSNNLPLAPPPPPTLQPEASKPPPPGFHFGISDIGSVLHQPCAVPGDPSDNCLATDW